MRWFLLAALALFSAGLMAEPIYNKTPVHEAFVARVTEEYEPTTIGKEPPAPKEEVAPDRPFPDAIWIPGYWAFVQQDFTWVCGIWRRPPPGKSWNAGSWNKNESGWVWAKGFWSAPENQWVYIPKKPPLSGNDNVPMQPDKNYFWIPGYWNYSQSTGDFKWLSGKWQTFNKNWILTPANYIWRPSGYVFVPLYWDYPIEQRGRAYSCDVGYSIIEPASIIQQLFYCYPDYVTLYSYWWFYNPGWWGDCWCFPPWWFWGDWWAFGWGELWELWWWWVDPEDDDDFAGWVDVVVIQELAAPPDQMVEFMRRVPHPRFPRHPGTHPVRPTGPRRTSPLPRPQPQVTEPSGTVTTPPYPSEPGQTVTPPPPPPPPTTTYTPSTYIAPPTQAPIYNPPTLNQMPPPSRRPQTPPSYTPPPQRTPPTTRTPPRTSTPPRTKTPPRTSSTTGSGQTQGRVTPSYTTKN